jgi:hypothetical protein
LRKTITLDLITTTENHIMRISRDSLDIAIQTSQFVRRVIANAAQTADRLRVRATDQKQHARKGTQLSQNKNARQRVVTPIDPAFW